MSHDDDPEEPLDGRFDRVVMSRRCLWAFSIAFAAMTGLAVFHVPMFVAVAGL